MLCKLSWQASHFIPAKERFCIYQEAWACISKRQVSTLESRAFQEDINMVNYQLHSNYRNSWYNFMAERVS